MSDLYNDIQWVIQRNLTSENVFAQLKSACEEIGVGYVEVEIVPFTAELPFFDRSRHSIFYGSTTFNQLVYKDRELNAGLFLSSQTFSIENYFKAWGERMLNYGAFVTSFSEITTRSFPADKLFFIRPDDDSKSFAGEVKRFDEIEAWYKNLQTTQNSQLSGDSKIIVSDPFHIKSEWRLWIVEGKVIAASKYRENFKLQKEKGCPTAVSEFAEERCKEYVPHDVFVMDIGLCGDEYYIIECGCMNSAGFYSADIACIVDKVTAYFSSVVKKKKISESSNLLCYSL